MGIAWAMGSMLLVSVAQLLLRRAMLELDLNHMLLWLRGGTGAGMLMAGLGCYLASMACWFMALRHLPLGKACSLLSLSYVLVWGMAILLPGWGESFRWSGAFGVLLIMAGVGVIFSPSGGKK